MHILYNTFFLHFCNIYGRIELFSGNDRWGRFDFDLFERERKTLKLLFPHIDEFELVFLLVVIVVDHTDYFER